MITCVALPLLGAPALCFRLSICILSSEPPTSAQLRVSVQNLRSSSPFEHTFHIADEEKVSVHPLQCQSTAHLALKLPVIDQAIPNHGETCLHPQKPVLPVLGTLPAHLVGERSTGSRTAAEVVKTRHRVRNSPIPGSHEMPRQHNTILTQVAAIPIRVAPLAHRRKAARTSNTGYLPLSAPHEKGRLTINPLPHNTCLKQETTLCLLPLAPRLQHRDSTRPLRAMPGLAPTTGLKRGRRALQRRRCLRAWPICSTRTAAGAAGPPWSLSPARRSGTPRQWSRTSRS